MPLLRRAAVAALTAASLILPAPGADAMTRRTTIVGFEGKYRGPGRLTTTSTCLQLYTNGTGTGIFPCTVTFTINRGTNVCELRADQAAGTASYYTNIDPALDRTNVPLTGADFHASGVVTGTVYDLVSATVFSIRISFAHLCEDEQATGRFVGDGHLL